MKEGAAASTAAGGLGGARLHLNMKDGNKKNAGWGLVAQLKVVYAEGKNVHIRIIDGREVLYHARFRYKTAYLDKIVEYVERNYVREYEIADNVREDRYKVRVAYIDVYELLNIIMSNKRSLAASIHAKSLVSKIYDLLVCETRKDTHVVYELAQPRDADVYATTLNTYNNFVQDQNNIIVRGEGGFVYAVKRDGETLVNMALVMLNDKTIACSCTRPAMLSCACCINELLKYASTNSFIIDVFKQLYENMDEITRRRVNAYYKARTGTSLRDALKRLEMQHCASADSIQMRKIHTDSALIYKPSEPRVKKF